MALLKLLALLYLFCAVFTQVDERFDDGSEDNDADVEPPRSWNPNQEVTSVGSPEELEEFVKNTYAPVVVGYFEQNHKDIEVFKEVADEFGKAAKFISVTDPDLLQRLGYKGANVFVYRTKSGLDREPLNIDKPKARYPSRTLHKKALTKFVAEKSVQTIGEWNLGSREIYEMITTPIIWVFAEYNRPMNENGYQFIVRRLKKAAEAYPGQFYYAISHKADHKKEIDDFEFPASLKNKKNEILVGLRVGETIYASTKPFTGDSVQKFIAQYLAGTIVSKPRTVKHVNPNKQAAAAAAAAAKKAEKEEKVVVKEEPSLAVIVTSKTFNSLVTDATADVMIEFYAPWCGHCKALKPEYNKLAKGFEDDDTIVIAVIDAEANKDFPKEYDVKGYPAIYYLPESTKKPIIYEGARTAAALRAFILEQKYQQSKFGNDVKSYVPVGGGI